MQKAYLFVTLTLLSINISSCYMKEGQIYFDPVKTVKKITKLNAPRWLFVHAYNLSQSELNSWFWGNLYKHKRVVIFFADRRNPMIDKITKYWLGTELQKDWVFVCYLTDKGEESRQRKYLEAFFPEVRSDFAAVAVVNARAGVKIKDVVVGKFEGQKHQTTTLKLWLDYYDAEGKAPLGDTYYLIGYPVYIPGD